MDEIKTPLAPEELRVLRNQLESESPPSAQSQFNYAWGLLRSASPRQVSDGVTMLEELYRNEPGMRREVLYYLALGSFKQGDYGNARRYTEQLLKIEPDNGQAKHLLEEIEAKVTKDGLIGLSMGVGALAVGVGILAGVLGGRRKR
ncbi:hypothetical protein DIURU_000257 [Diutina rugosa]|uniref:Mitochondrial fission 1 protein n=1 Tax=Diutina rugosa TaxID=5481 RepID=A0A642V481_DIURU|nr:uncharacterized protein DIURU_000257 [Diutina rugosa]KAA8908288.1 hypothetical protein DIURU_000257 [Diutina rugosa]